MKADNKSVMQYAYDKTGKTKLDEQWKKFSKEQLSERPFDPEGNGYDYKSAIQAGLQPEADEEGVLHWPSRIPSGPNEGLLLKGRQHETWHKTELDEKELGYTIKKKTR